ncbi:MAG: hypothetical protein K9N55_14155 [Phycisphaerae bacterium]|nr:hypothetical protein [Phycisphaerae bacterium]
MKQNLYVLIHTMAMLTLLMIPQTLTSAPLLPGAAFDYKDLAFEPDRWKQQGISTQVVPWEGDQLVFITTPSELDATVMTQFVGRLETAWSLYADLTGRQPRLFRQWQGKPTIAAIPSATLTCGYGCGYIGATGIEVTGFYNSDYPLALKDQDAFHHYYFYEMGRNFYTFGDRHSLFTTGYAVFMRYVCMDTLRCDDSDVKTRQTIEDCEAVYAASDVPFMTAFTNLSKGEKGNRLRDTTGRTISPSDQPVMYACAMLKLYKDHGGNEWLRRFYRHLARCPRVRVETESQAITQCLNWLVSASAAARQDLTPIFADRWRMPLDTTTREMLSRVRWSDPALDVARVLESLKTPDKAPQKIILKLDDVVAAPSSDASPVSPRWRRVTEFLSDSNLKASFGIIGYSLEQDNKAYFDWIAAAKKSGLVEFWHHGYRQRKATDPTGEFEESFEVQKIALERTQALAKEKLGITFTCFGPHWSGTNEHTIRALEGIPEITMWFYGPQETSKFAFERVLTLEDPVHVPDFAKFKATYDRVAFDKPYLALQGHPNSWDDERWDNFVQIIDFLKSKGCVFVTPSDYLKTAR